MIGPNISRDELRAVGIATLTAACATAATGLVTWAIEEAKAAVQRRRQPPPAQEPSRIEVVGR